MADYLEAPGIDPTTTGTNRSFWNDRFTEPKQQHRFTVRFPVYTPVGKNKDIVKLVEELIPEVQKKTPPPTPDTSNIPNYNLMTPAEKIRAVYNLSPPNRSTALWQSAIGVGPGPKKYRTEHIYLRTPEYIAFSFTPPSFDFRPKSLGLDGAAEERRVDAGTLARSAATLTFVTTLRDDLNFSLNFLWRLGFGLGKGADAHPPRGVALFPPSITQLTDKEKYVTIYEHYARTVRVMEHPVVTAANDVRTLIGKDSDSETNPSAVSGIHKLYDPIIESVNFGELTYGGTELVKITVGLTYNGNQKNFYSYQNTDSRYGKGKVYAMDEGTYAESQNRWRKKMYGDEGPPAKGSLRYAVTNFPNFAASETTKRYQTLKQAKASARSVGVGDGEGMLDSTDLAIERLKLKEVFEGKNTAKYNEVFSKSISAIISKENAERDAEREASVAERDTRRALNESDAASQERRNEINAHIEQKRAEQYVQAIIDRSDRLVEMRNAQTEQRDLQANQGGNSQDILARRIARLSDN